MRLGGVILGSIAGDSTEAGAAEPALAKQYKSSPAMIERKFLFGEIMGRSFADDDVNFTAQVVFAPRHSTCNLLVTARNSDTIAKAGVDFVLQLAFLIRNIANYGQ
ncbi:MAG TPA: hypothetical protein VM553_06150 [Dongiaceae bacterium]|nr:hypothetical protein [Dongiaceae bacterium]